MNIFEKIFKAFNQAGINYLVVGGVAVNLYGYVRFTADLDILLLLEEQNLKKTELVMKKLGYKERLPISIMDLKNKDLVQKWLKEKNLKAFSFIPGKDNPLVIDIIIEESLNFQIIAREKVIKKIDETAIPVISLPALLKMKKRASREQDLVDLKALIKIKKNMKKSGRKQRDKEILTDVTLKHWKNVSVKGKLDWLNSALRFGKLKKF